MTLADLASIEFSSLFTIQTSTTHDLLVGLSTIVFESGYIFAMFTLWRISPAQKILDGHHGCFGGSATAAADPRGVLTATVGEGTAVETVTGGKELEPAGAVADCARATVSRLS